MPDFSNLPGAHEETPVDRLLTFQEKIRAARERMKQSGVPLLEQGREIERLAAEGAEILREGTVTTSSPPIKPR